MVCRPARNEQRYAGHGLELVDSTDLAFPCAGIVDARDAPSRVGAQQTCGCFAGGIVRADTQAQAGLGLVPGYDGLGFVQGLRIVVTNGLDAFGKSAQCGRIRTDDGDDARLRSRPSDARFDSPEVGFGIGTKPQADGATGHDGYGSSQLPAI